MKNAHCISCIDRIYHKNLTSIHTLMKKKICFLLLSALVMLTASNAYGQETVESEITINGVPLAKKVKKVQLSNNTDYRNFSMPTEKVVLIFENSEGKEEMEEYYPTTVKQLFGDAVSIHDLTIYDAGEQEGILGLGGIEPGTAIQVYDMTGKLRLNSSAGDHTSIDLSGLPRGMYVVRCGKVAIKLMKK